MSPRTTRRKTKNKCGKINNPGEHGREKIKVSNSLIFLFSVSSVVKPK
jgi:hypothetical protein